MTVDMDAARACIRPIVNELTVARHAAGLTQRQLAAMFGSRQSEIGAWENLRMVPTVLSLAEWAAALGYELALLPAQAEEEPAS